MWSDETETPIEGFPRALSSNVYMRQARHFLTDIAFGAAIGVVAGRTVTIGRGPARFVVSPVASAGVAGVALTWIGEP